MCIDTPEKLRDEGVAVGLVNEYFADDPVTVWLGTRARTSIGLAVAVVGRRRLIRPQPRTCWP
jgi:hypothetical protein